MMFLVPLLRDLPVLMLLVLGDMTGSLAHDVPGTTVETQVTFQSLCCWF